MTILNYSSRYEPEDHAPVLVCLPLPLALPNDPATFFPIRDDIRAEHILLDGCRGHECVPNFSNWSVNADFRSRDEATTYTTDRNIYLERLISQW